VVSDSSKPTSPHISSEPAAQLPNRTLIEERIQAEKARKAPSLELSRSALWTRRKSAAIDEETET
jgi:hypothetical protein